MEPMSLESEPAFVICLPHRVVLRDEQGCLWEILLAALPGPLGTLTLGESSLHLGTLTP